MKTKSYFGKDESVAVGAILVLFMVWLHLFHHPTWIKDGLGWSCLTPIGTVIAEKLAGFGGICVPTFAMMSGYALWVKPSAYGTWRARFKRILKVLLVYWTIFALFLIIGLAMGDEVPALSTFLANLIGLKAGMKPWPSVPFAWYITFYLEFVLLSPLLLWMFSGRRWWQDAAAFVAVIATVRFRYYAGELGLQLWPLTAAAAGVLAAKYNVVELIGRFFKDRIHFLFLPLIVAGLVIERFLFGRLNPLGGG